MSGSNSLAVVRSGQQEAEGSDGHCGRKRPAPVAAGVDSGRGGVGPGDEMLFFEIHSQLLF